MATTSIDYNHPYVSLHWEHRATAGTWENDAQDATLLSGYVSGQGTKTLELSGASVDEAGYLRCGLTIPDGSTIYTDDALLSAEAAAPVFTVGIDNVEVYEGSVAQFGPVTVAGSPVPDLVWEAEITNGSDTWDDVNVAFGDEATVAGDTLYIGNTIPANNRGVRANATNTFGSTTTQALLTVTPKLAFVSVEPTDKTITATGGAPAESTKT